jgi:hypothetical protein
LMASTLSAIRRYLAFEPNKPREVISPAPAIEEIINAD